MFSSGSFRSISLATVTPSLVMVGDPNFLSRTTLRPFGPRVTFTASASWLTPRRTAWRDCSPYTICFAISLFSCSLRCRRRAWRAGEPGRLLLLLLAAAVFDHGEYLVFAHDEVFLALELDLLAGVLAEEDQVTGLDVERDPLAVVFRLAVARGNHLALLRLFFRGIGDDDSADLLLAFLDALNNDAVMQRSDVHAFAP